MTYPFAPINAFGGRYRVGDSMGFNQNGGIGTLQRSAARPINGVNPHNPDSFGGTNPYTDTGMSHPAMNPPVPGLEMHPMGFDMGGPQMESAQQNPFMLGSYSAMNPYMNPAMFWGNMGGIYG